ncbi:hypothetical protein [Chitinophaga sp. HK235]|uniref:hypothetical protein n=1 Tax=Chitinophaga sp. HK235 TaxID=2952571 RepID=UPI001BA63BCC|nr:hypothetical protein [Chitinophaga sp. HK235]
MDKKAFIKQLYALWMAPDTRTCIEQYALMAEALMQDQGIRFDGDEQREWFYETINKNARDPFRNFYAAACVAMSFKNISKLAHT